MADYNSRINSIDLELSRFYIMGEGAPQTRAEGLMVKDLKNTRASLLKQRRRAACRPGYENLMNLKGQGRQSYGL